MKKLLLTIAIAHTAHYTFAQNNVPNSSFETYQNCPSNFSSEAPWTLTDWFSPINSLPDYFNVCNNSLNGMVGIPGNECGYQSASSGNGYIGMYIISDATIPDYKHYISVELTGCGSGNCALVPGADYRVSIDVSLAEKLSNVSCDGIGAYFFTNALPNSYKTSWETTLPFTPEIDYSSFGPITDTVNWVTLTDTFQADSAYRYIVIGGVVPKQNINAVRHKIDSRGDIAYYYIDNIKVEPLSITSVRNETLPQITIAPNPVKDRAVLRLSGGIGSSYSISLTNTLGQNVWQRSAITENEIVFERGTLTAGVYYYQLSLKGQVAQKGKLVLE